MTRIPRIVRLLFPGTIAAAGSLALAIGLAACDIGSTDSTSAVLADRSGTIYDFSGLYMHPGGNPATPLVYPAGRQSGTAVTWLRLLQHGSVLEGYDNARQNWSGKISTLNGPEASFTLRGRTSAGQGVDIAGTLTYENEKARINATWIEPQFSGSFFGLATVAAAVTSSPPQQISITPPSTTLGPGNTTVRLTASGGSGTYTWSVSTPNLGNVAPSTGASVTYTSQSIVGRNTITVEDSAGNSATATVTYSTTGGNGDSGVVINPQIYMFHSGAGVSVSFTASGGILPYTWTVSNSNLGILNSTTGTTVIYNRTAASGNNTITVTDGTGQTGTARVEQ